MKNRFLEGGSLSSLASSLLLSLVFLIPSLQRATDLHWHTVCDTRNRWEKTCVVLQGTGQGWGQAGTSICRSGSVPVRGIGVRCCSGIAASPGIVSLQIGPDSAERAEERWRPMTYAISGTGTDGPRLGWNGVMNHGQGERGSPEEVGKSGPDGALVLPVPGKEPPLFSYGLGPAAGNSSEGTAQGVLVGMEGHGPPVSPGSNNGQ